MAGCGLACEERFIGLLCSSAPGAGKAPLCPRNCCSPLPDAGETGSSRLAERRRAHFKQWAPGTSGHFLLRGSHHRDAGKDIGGAGSWLRNTGRTPELGRLTGKQGIDLEGPGGLWTHSRDPR
ncbi:hypothetical protein NDU88_001770 [Pleurodeles waltl]|uniref:Uncharacterized protein n=1 Tax=Pleurodeles waltl TaxID=8319 RepID=A0AAV7W2I4_PLEWA|nr:hypothetical protein NDU88_001770 [Pleurodeles waltl]